MAGSGISTMAGSGREIQKGKLSLFVTAYHPVKETNPTTFLDFHLTSRRRKAKFYMREKSKTENSYSGFKKNSITSVKLEFNSCVVI